MFKRIAFTVSKYFAVVLTFLGIGGMNNDVFAPTAIESAGNTDLNINALDETLSKVGLANVAIPTFLVETKGSLTIDLQKFHGANRLEVVLEADPVTGEYITKTKVVDINNATVTEVSSAPTGVFTGDVCGQPKDPLPQP